MIHLAAEAAKARLEAASVLREACEGQHHSATDIRAAFLFDVFRVVPSDLAKLAHALDGMKP